MADIRSYIDAKHNTELFKGIFMILDVGKNYEESRILKNKINLFDKKELIDTDNELFNKYFEIHAYDKDNVNYLTPVLIEFIANFRERYKINFEIVFKDKVYIRFYKKDMFEPKMFGKIEDEYSVYQFFVMTKFAKEFAEKLGVM